MSLSNLLSSSSSFPLPSSSSSSSSLPSPLFFSASSPSSSLSSSSFTFIRDDPSPCGASSLLLHSLFSSSLQGPGWPPSRWPQLPDAPLSSPLFPFLPVSLSSSSPSPASLFFTLQGPGRPPSRWPDCLGTTSALQWPCGWGPMCGPTCPPTATTSCSAWAPVCQSWLAMHRPRKRLPLAV